MPISDAEHEPRREEPCDVGNLFDRADPRLRELWGVNCQVSGTGADGDALWSPLYEATNKYLPKALLTFNRRDAPSVRRCCHSATTG